MTNPEIKVGQKYRVVDAVGFGYAGVVKGDVHEVFTRELIEDGDCYYGISEDEMIITPSEIVEGIVELVEDAQKLSKDAPVFSKGQVWEVRGHLLGESVRRGSYVWVDAVTINFCGEAAEAYPELTKETLVHLKDSDVAHGRIRKVADNIDEYFYGDSTEPSEDDSPIWARSIPEGVKTHAQEVTGTPESIIEAADRVLSVKHENCDDQEPIKFHKNKPTDIQSGLSAELLWKFIEGSSGYNGHKQFEVSELPWDVLKDAVKTLGEYLENDEDTLATSLEIRLMYNGNLSEKFKHTWGASVYQLDYWEAGEHKDGHRDRLLFGVEIVRGI